MIPYVVANGGASIDDLRDRFDYPSSAAVVKDLHVIFLTGLPGYGPGDLIDVDIFDDEVVIESADHFSSALRLTPGEALGLLAAGTAFLASNQAPPALAGAVEKLARAIGVDVEEQVLLDVPTPDSVGVLRRAIEDSRAVQLDYVARSTNARTTRIVEGESVFFNLGTWYFRGHCRFADAERLFRVDRIAAIDVLDERYVPTAASSLATAQYEPSADDHVVVFDVAPASRWVTEYYPVDVEVLPEGVSRVTMRVSDPMVAARLLVRLGSDATLVDGEAVEQAKTDLAARIQAVYANDG